MKWYTDLGLAGERLRLREHDKDELSHYSRRHGRHRVRVPVPAAGRVRRAGRHRPPRRLRPAQPHGRQAREERRGLPRSRARRRRQAEAQGQRQRPDVPRRRDERAVHAARDRAVGRRRPGDARVPLRGVSRGPGAGRQGRDADPRGDEVPSADRAGQGGRVPAGEEGRHARGRPGDLPRAQAAVQRRSTTRRAPSAAAIAARTRPARRTASPSTARRCRTTRSRSATATRSSSGA